MERARLAADIGGTFTDVVLEHAGRRRSVKVLTTPRAAVPAAATAVSAKSRLRAAKSCPGKKPTSCPRATA